MTTLLGLLVRSAHRATIPARTANVEFGALASGEFLSVVGDQLARVALAILVFQRTGSTSITGITYALTFLPNVLGGVLLSSLADRFPRRDVMIAIDAGRAMTAAMMAVPGTPLVVIACLVAATSLLNGPFKGAYLALLRDVLGRERYTSGMALRQSFGQAAQLAGFAGGGFLAANVSVGICLLANGASFAASALIVGIGVRRRSASAAAGARSLLGLGSLRIVWNDAGRRAVFLVTFTGFFLIAAEALIAPLVAGLGLGGSWVGILLISLTLSSVLVLPLVRRLLTPERTAAILPVLCVAPGAAFALIAAGRSPWWIIVVFALAGALWSVLTVTAVSLMAELLPDDQRAQGMSIASTMNLTSQGVGAAVAGTVAGWIGPTATVAALGLGCALFGILPIRLWHAHRSAAHSS